MPVFPTISANEAASIASFCGFGMSATKSLHAVCRLLGTVTLPQQGEASQMAADLAQVLVGMQDQLQVIHDAFDNIGIYATPYQDEATDHHAAPAPQIVH